VKIPANVVAKPEAARVASILEGLDENVPGAEVFEAFEQLDDLPADVVRAVLVSVNGPAPNPDQLDAATRRAHGFPELPLVFRCTSALRPTMLGELNRLEQEQLKAAGTSWDGLDLPASARLAQNGGEPSFAGSLELKRFSFDDGAPALDVVLYGEGSGALFDTGTSRLVGAVAYGVVELKDKAARTGLQNVLSSQPDPAALARAEAARAKADAAAKAEAEARAKAEAEARAKAEAEARAKAKADAKAKAEADAAAFAAAQVSLFPADEPTTQKRLKVPAKAVAAPKVAAAKKAAAAEAAPRKAAVPKKAAAAPKKAAAAAAAKKKTAAAPKKAAAAPKAAAAAAKKKKAAAPEKAASAAAKKKRSAAAPKRSAAAPKKAAAAPKKAAAVPKKAAAVPKKASAKKATAKKATAKKATAKKAAAAPKKAAAAPKKKATAKKPAAKTSR